MEEKVREEEKNAVKLMDESRRKTSGVKFDSVEVIRSLRDTFSFSQKTFLQAKTFTKNPSFFGKAFLSKKMFLVKICVILWL
jgi:hypothetical protein